MPKKYSTYEAKARLSEILRLVREGQTITVTYHGEPVAEIRPLDMGTRSIEARMRRLEERGVLVRGGDEPGRFATVQRRPGALQRFLAERDA
jgi:prevent-host-death family protein